MRWYALLGFLGCIWSACDRPSVPYAEQLLAEGRTLTRDRQLDEALVRLEKAKQIFKRAGRLEQLAETDKCLGIAWFRKGEGKKSEACLLKALAYQKKRGNLPEQVTLKKNLAIIYNSTERFEESEQLLIQCLDHYRQLDDGVGSFDTYGVLAGLHRLQLKPEKELADLEAALLVAQTINDPQREIRARFDIGYFYQNHEPKKALAQYKAILPQIRESGQQAYILGLYNNLAVVYLELGETGEAFKALEQALLQSSESRHKAQVYLNLGKAHMMIGENQHALENLRRAREIFQETSDRLTPLTEAWTMFYMGQLMDKTGDRDQARRLLEEALAVFVSHGDLMMQRTAHQALGDHYNLWSMPEQALDHHQRALALAVRGAQMGDQIQAAGRIGETLFELGRPKEALCWYDQALTWQQTTTMTLTEGLLRHNIAISYLALKQLDLARNNCLNAISIFRVTRNLHSEALALHTFAKIQQAEGHLQLALEAEENGLELMESLRAQLESRHLRTSFTATIHEFYNFKIELLLSQNQDETGPLVAEALAVSEQARARSLLESLFQISFNEGDQTAGPQQEQLQKQRHDLRRQLDGKVNYRHLLSEKQTPGPELNELERELDQLIWDYRELDAQYKALDHNRASLNSIKPLAPEEMQSLLDEDSLLLQYSLCDQAGYLWLVSWQKIKVFRLPDRQWIRDRAKELSALVNEPNRKIRFETEAERRLRIVAAKEKWLRVSQQLATKLLPPAADMEGKRLVIVADDALHYLPFGLLPEPGSEVGPQWQPLIVNHEVVNIPSLSVLAALKKTKKTRSNRAPQLVIFADPVFDAADARLPESIQLHQPERNLVRLPYTGDEALAISALTRDVTVFSGFQATREAVLRDHLSPFSILHFATHGRVDSRIPEMSGLVFSGLDAQGRRLDSLLSRNDILEMRLTADLVVLSACQTALGTEIRGEGLVGLTQSFMFAGAPRLVASLWNIQDRATSQLMVDFYKNLLELKRPPAHALREAQLEAWRQGQDPFYWGAFVFIGPWTL